MAAQNGLDQPWDEPEELLEYPPFEDLDTYRLYGTAPPSQEQRDRAAEAISGTPKDAAPIAIARSFVTRFEATPDVISQWPRPAAWNPLVVEFFSATDTKVNNDMTAWCAAFANWCLERGGKTGTKSASSQSFLNHPAFEMVQSPQAGDLVIFTCYSKAGTNMGIGHVGFFDGLAPNDRIRVLGGNQISNRMSTICTKTFAKVFKTRRHRNGEVIDCTMKLTAYLRPK